MIKLININKTFFQGKHPINALSDINLHVPAGKIMGVIGASGAGKSTLIRCVNLLESPSSGEVLVDGVNMTHLNSAALAQKRRCIGMIFQHFNLLASRTVFGNVALPLELDHKSTAEINERVLYLLNMVGLTDKQTAYPNALSGGQKQRVAIARALANNPKVLLCDEATSALDPATTRSILDLLKEINNQLGLTILLITHEMDVVKTICDRVAVISQGRLIEQNSVNEIFSHPQTALAQQFIQSSLHIAIPDDYQKRLSHQQTSTNQVPLLRMEFTGRSVDAPLISQTAKNFDLDISILSAKMDYVGGIKFGIMLAEFFGTVANTQAAIHFLQQRQVNIEVLGYV